MKLTWIRLRTAKNLFLLGSSDTDPIKVFPCEPLTFQKTMRIFMFVLLNCCTFCVISCADGAQLVTYCVRFYTNVEINSQELFVGLIPVHIIYALLLQTSRCRKFGVHWRKFFALKPQSRIFFKNITCALLLKVIQVENMRLCSTPDIWHNNHNRGLCKEI